MTETLTQDKFPLELSIEKIAYKRKFNALDDLKLWLEGQQHHWRDFLYVPNEYSHMLKNALDALFFFAPNRMDNDDFDVHLLIRKINEASSHGFFPVDTEQGRYIRRLKEKFGVGPAAITASILADRSNITELRRDNNTINIGIISAIAFVSVGDPLGSSEFIRESAAIARELKEEINENSSDVAKLVEGINSKFNANLESFKQDLSLKAPKEYWNNRSNAHEKLAIKARNDWKLLLVSELVAFIIMVPVIFSGAIDDLFRMAVHSTGMSLSTPNINSGQNLVQLAKIAQHTLTIGTMLGFGIWFLRQTLRKALSHEHLAEDAAERVTMVETFSALKHAGLAESEVGPILNALYRPASTGLIADDGPMTPLEIIIKEVAKKASGKE